jgi:hypothetical protein
MLLSLSSFADHTKADQSADLTGFDRFDHYSNWSATDKGTYTLKRDSKSPDKIIVRIAKKFTNASFETSQHHFDGLKYLGSTSQTHPARDEIVVELDFTDANKLKDGEVEELILNLQFADEEINIKKVGMNSADTDRAYEIDKDTWGIDDSADVRYEFISSSVARE